MEYENMTSFIPCCIANSTLKYNSTSDFPYHRSPYFNALGCLATIALALASIFGNAAVVFASFWHESLRVQTGNRLIVYLSCSDILTAIFVMIPSALAVAMDYWPLGFVGCKMNSFFNYMFACSSSVCIALISVDRAIAVTYPLNYRSLVTDKVVFGFLSWLFIQGSVVGAVCGTLKWSRYDYTEGVCTINYKANNTQAVFYIITSSCCVCYFVPLGIMSVCNLMIIRAAKKSGKKNAQPVFVRRDQSDSLMKKTSNSKMKKTIKSMIVVVAKYYVCFSPYALTKLVKVLLRVDIPPWLNYVATLFLFVASATNPFIYAILRKEYRDAFKRILKILMAKCFCSKKLF